VCYCIGVGLLGREGAARAGGGARARPLACQRRTQRIKMVGFYQISVMQHKHIGLG